MSISLTQPTIGSTSWGSAVNTNWQTIEDAINAPTLSKTANYTVVLGDAGKTILCDATSGDFTITLLSAATAGSGFIVKIIKINSTNVVTVDTTSSQTVNGALTNELNSAYSSLTVVSNGSNWFILHAVDWIQATQSSATNFFGNGTWGDGASIDLPAGEWDLSACTDTSRNGSNITQVNLGISSTSGNSTAGLVLGDNRLAGTAPTAVTNNNITIPSYRVIQTSSIPWYLKLVAVYTTGTPQFTCRLSARRVN